MSYKAELKSIYDDQLKELEKALERLKVEEKEFERDPIENQESLEKVKSKIVNTYEDIAKTNGEKAKVAELAPEVKDSIENMVAVKEKLSSFLNGVKNGIIFSIELHRAVISQELSQDLGHLQSALNQSRPAIMCVENPGNNLVFENIPETTKIFQKENEDKDKINDLKNNLNEIFDAAKEALELIEENEKKSKVEPEKDAQKKWEKDIVQKENELNESKNSQEKKLKYNLSLFESLAKDVSQFPDSEKKLKALEPQLKLYENEYKKINQNFENGMKELEGEKKVFQQAIDSAAKERDPEMQNKSIQDARIEFVKQKELERLKELELENKSPQL